MSESQDKMLCARLDDLVRRSDSGVLSHSAFLSPEQLARAEKHLAVLGERVVSYGGFPSAERRLVFILPPYMSDIGGGEELFKEYFSDEVGEAIGALHIKGSGYRELSHRDYLGSLLALGLEREVIGDILVRDGHSAVVLCSGAICNFIISSLDRVASDKVTVERYLDTDGLRREESFERISSTVASERLDCVVGALCSVSRATAQELIKRELCQVSYEVETRCDRALASPCIISVRGYGKFILRGFDGQTKKGRYRLVADKYI